MVAGGVAVAVTVRATPSGPGEAPVAQTVTVTAGPPPSPVALPVEQADEKTCAGWAAARATVVEATKALAVIPDGLNVLSPEVQTHPEWKAGVAKASALFVWTAATLERSKAAGTSPMLDHVTDTTAGALRAMATAYRTCAPEAGDAFDVFNKSQKTMDWLCR